MSLRSKLPIEARIALMFAKALKAQRETQPKSLYDRVKDMFLLPAVAAVFTGLSGLAFGLGTNYYQAKFQSAQTLNIWQIQHKIETSAKLLSIRMELLSSFQDAISRYFDFDMETSIENNLNTLKAAVKLVIPDFDTNAFKNTPIFPTAEQMKEHRENWSKLQALSQSIEMYFGDNVGGEISSVLTQLDREPSSNLDLNTAVSKITELKDSKNVNIHSMQNLIKPYLASPNYSADLNRKLHALGLDMKCIIRNTIEIEANLVKNSCSSE